MTTVRSASLALAALVALALFPLTAVAQPPAPAPDWTITLAGRVWAASGWSNWSFTSAGVDPLSDVRWRGVDGVLGELTADVTWKRLVWVTSVGGTKLDDGTLVQEEFARSDRQNRFSLTRSPVDEGHLLYVSNDVGARVARWQAPLFGGAPAPAGGYLDAFVGYQYWREEYVGVGAQGSLFLPGLTVNQAEPRSTKVLTHQYTRHSVRIGARAQVPLVGGLSLKALAAISPWTHTDHQAEQHLRTDIQAPTRSTANGGFGAQVEAGLAFAVWRGLSAEAGFRYWYFDSGSGEVTTTSTTGAVSRDALNEAITERYGPYLGISWRF
jgi:hypothetical protein